MRRYSVPMLKQSVSAAKDLIVITAPSTKVLVLLRANIGQDGDTTSEQNLWSIFRITGGPNTGTSITPKALDAGDPAAAFTASYLPASANTKSGVAMEARPFNWLIGDEWVPEPESRIWVPAGSSVIVRLEDAPAAAKTVTCKVTVGEIG